MAKRHLKIAWALARLYCRTVERRWYRRPPFLPLPPRTFLRWRLRTAYGAHRPPWTEILRDLWRFGDWLARFPAENNDTPKKG
jgi:hypothetical protein